MTTELTLVNKQSEIGRQIDPSLIIQGSHEADMVGLSAGTISLHELGIFVVEKPEGELKAVGYIACTEILQASLRDAGDLRPSYPEFTALIGGLYVHPDFREEGLGHRLVQAITDRTFAEHGQVAACEAKCNKDSLSKFLSTGYNPMTGVRGRGNSETKIPVMTRRLQWEWHKKFQNATIDSEHGND